MSFLSDSLDLFSGKRVSHMGLHQYVDHAAIRDGKSMSGARLWAKAQIEREKQFGCGHTNLVGTEQRLLQKVASEIEWYLPMGLRVVELGPGTLSSFAKKTLPLLKKLKSDECIIVDESMAFLREIAASSELDGIKTQLIEDDFFEGDHFYKNDGTSSLICMFGSIISNILAPISHQLPEKELIAGLRNLSSCISDGWILLSFDADQNGTAIKSYYESQGLFQVNIFDRMKIELPINKNFDPKAFDYEAKWISQSGQLGHMAVLNRDLNFKLANQNITLLKGQKLHLKNSYKFQPDFFERCCGLANLEVINAWADSSSTKIYLLKKSTLAITGADFLPIEIRA